MDAIKQFLHYIPLSDEWIYSLLWIPAVVMGRSVLLRWYFSSHESSSIEDKRRVLVVSRNVSLLLGVFGLLLVWASQIQTFALSMVALAAASVVATKELIMCLSGSVLRLSTKQYSVGDYIEINGLRGRVIDINLFNTLMMQLGPHSHISNLSGKTVSFPNSWLLSHTLLRDNILGGYVVHTFDIPVLIHLDSDAIVPHLYDIAQELCAPFMADIAAHFETVQMHKLFITPAAKVRVSRVPFDDKTYKIVVRFAAPVAKRLEIQQAILDEFFRIQYRLLQEKAA